MGMLSDWSQRLLGCLGAVLAGAASWPLLASAGGVDAELADIVARMDYGYYAADSRILEAARAELDRLPGNGARKTYFKGYGAYRLSQLSEAADSRRRNDLISDCIEAGKEAAADPQWSVEAWVLVAACSLEGRDDNAARKLVYELRLKEATSAARALAPNHPRLLLVSVWAESEGGNSDDVENRRETLERARAGFEVLNGRDGDPAWGEAETLASLGKIYLERGQLREARDLIEQALIVAPEYHFALELRSELSLPR